MAEAYQELLDRRKLSMPQNVHIKETGDVEVSLGQGFSGGGCTPEFDADGKLTGFNILIDRRRAPFQKLLILLHESGHAHYGFEHKLTLEQRKACQTSKEDNLLFDIESERAAMINTLEQVITLTPADFDLLDEAMSQIIRGSGDGNDTVHRNAARKVIASATWKHCEDRRNSATDPCLEVLPSTGR